MVDNGCSHTRTVVLFSVLRGGSLLFAMGVLLCIFLGGGEGVSAVAEVAEVAVPKLKWPLELMSLTALPALP